MTPPRTTLQLIFDPEFGAALLGKVILNTSFWAQTILLIVLTYERTGSAAWVGGVTAVQLLPQLFLALVSGSMADKRGPRRPIVSGGACSGLGCIGLAFWFAVADGMQFVPVQVPLLVASTVSGVGIALASTAMQAVPQRLSNANERATAMSLNFLPTALARTLGPVAGAFLASGLGPVLALTVTGAACLVGVVIFMSIRRLGTPGNRSAATHSLRRVLGHIRRDKQLLAVLGAVGAIGAGSEAAITLAPAIGKVLGIGASGAGTVTGAFGLGGLVGVLAFRICSRFLPAEAVGYVSMLLLGASLVSIGLARSLPFAIVMLIVAGASMVMGITAFSIVGQQRSPAEFLGRFMALWIMAFAGVRPAAGITMGFISDHVSTTAAVIGAGVITAVATYVVYLLMSDRPTV